MGAETPAGWYPNPWNDAEELYWSGVEWTGISRAAHRAPAPIASEIEDATIMRPVGTHAQPLFPPPLVWTDATATAAAAAALPVGAPASSPGPPVEEEPPPAAYAPPASYAPAPAPQADSADATSIRWALNASAPEQPTNPRAKFGLVAMILGIAAAVFAVVPGLSFAAWIPAFVALGLGIVGYLGGRPRGFALTGIITAGAALAVGTAVSIWFIIQLGVLGR